MSLRWADRDQLDLAKPDEIRSVIREIRPGMIVNAAAYTAVDQAERDEALARSINADAVALMVEEAKKIDASLIHYSTDYVFGGSKKSPYEETDWTNPISVYGQTKLAGEQAISDSGVPHLIFRTGWVYSTSWPEFSPYDFAACIEARGVESCPRSSRSAHLVPRNRVGNHNDPRSPNRDRRSGSTHPLSKGFSGTYHMTAGGVTTRYEFAQAILHNASKASPTQSAGLPLPRTAIRFLAPPHNPYHHGGISHACPPPRHIPCSQIRCSLRPSVFSCPIGVIHSTSYFRLKKVALVEGDSGLRFELLVIASGVTVKR